VLAKTCVRGGSGGIFGILLHPKMTVIHSVRDFLQFRGQSVTVTVLIAHESVSVMETPVYT